MKSKDISLHDTYPVGMVVTTARGFLSVEHGSLGVVYEHYTIGKDEGVSIIFSNGTYDGFSERCTEMLDVMPQRIESSVCDYQFKDVMKLSQDFDRGLFKAALQKMSKSK